MWAGQFAGELLNWAIKHIMKQERPPGVFRLIVFSSQKEVTIPQAMLGMGMVSLLHIVNTWHTSPRS
jgi:hypothetical protein